VRADLDDRPRRTGPSQNRIRKDAGVPAADPAPTGEPPGETDGRFRRSIHYGGFFWRPHGTLCIIISPTRELSIQTYEVLERLAQPFPWIVPGLIMGGETKKKEKARLRKGVSILVATPGRLLDHLNNTRSMVTNHLQFLVLDEADRLLELGFEKYLFEIMTQLTDRAIKRIRRQNLLISATLPDRVKKLATTSLRNPMFISVIGSKGSVSTVESALLHDRTPAKPQKKGKKNEITEEEMVDEEEDLLLREKLSRLKREAATNSIKNKDREGGGDKEESNDGDEGLDEHEIKGRDGYVYDEDDMGSFVNTPKKLVQTFVQVPCKRRLAALYGFLQTKVFLHAPNLPAYLRPFKPKKTEQCKVIVFVSTTAEVEFIYSLFSTTQFFLKHVDTSVDGDEDDDEFLTQPLDKPPKSPFFSPSRVSKKKNKSSSSADDDAAEEDDAPAPDDDGDDAADQDPATPKKRRRKGREGGAVLWKLHGNMEQKDRTQSFQEFRHAPHGALICTDVAARGLDVPDVHWIVQWDPAIRIKEYIHRIGRTARMEGRGNALTFLTPSEYQYLSILQDHGMTLHRIDADVLLNEIKVPNMRTTDPPAFVMLQKKFEALIDEDKKMQKLARESFRSFVRSYATYPKSLKHVFHIKNLHLGHVAKSFALKQAPSSLLSTSSEKANSARQFRPDLAKTKSPRVHSDPSTHAKKPELSDFKHTMEGLSRFKRLTVDEYGSGF